MKTELRFWRIPQRVEPPFGEIEEIKIIIESKPDLTEKVTKMVRDNLMTKNSGWKES